MPNGIYVCVSNIKKLRKKCNCFPIKVFLGDTSKCLKNTQ